MPETLPDPRGTVRKTVGTPREREPVAVVWRLRQHLRSLGILPVNPDAHVRKRVGRDVPGRG
ncbi:hypothetical protein [Rubrivirga sp.]|uniref:hypothetical protein n=1 Tax=Rubrivirga sp. TaxID=1885344 RepID=UPI003B52559D